MRAVKLRSNKVLQLLTGAAGLHRLSCKMTQNGSDTSIKFFLFSLPISWQWGKMHCSGWTQQQNHKWLDSFNFINCWNKKISWPLVCVVDDSIFGCGAEVSNVQPCCSRHWLVTTSLQWLHTVIFRHVVPRIVSCKYCQHHLVSWFTRLLLVEPHLICWDWEFYAHCCCWSC